jgi:integrase
VLESRPGTDCPFVFQGRGGRQRKDINKLVGSIKEKAGFPKDFRTVHGLRHVRASMLASGGEVDMYILQKRLTHRSPQMTMRYAYLRNETLKRASDVAGEVISEVLCVSSFIQRFPEKTGSGACRAMRSPPRSHIKAER